MIGKFVTKLIQSLPSWEVTKYYGRVCIYQLKCLKYKIQTSEAWFNFKCKFMPGSLQNELECEEPVQKKVKNESKQKKVSDIKAQNKVKYLSKSNKSSATSIKDSYVPDEFMTKEQRKQEKCKDNEKYTVHEDVMQKKQRKVKRAQ
ncbi:hypothetical protein ANTPLA_LOCUS344 [Anthophora plagiata]